MYSCFEILLLSILLHNIYAFANRYGIPESNISVHAYKGHWLAYDNAKRIPIWVAELLNKDTLHQNRTADRHQSHFKVNISRTDGVAYVSEVLSGRS